MKKEIPILFSTTMVEAMIAGLKTQTRRIINPQPDESGLHDHDRFPMSLNSTLSGWWGTTDEGEHRQFKCPYGNPGDILYVREEHYRYGKWVAIPGVKTKTGRMKYKFTELSTDIKYNDDPPPDFRKGRHHKDSDHVGWYKRLARFMPKTAARIWLEVVDVRVERLQDISEEDAKAEGLEIGDLLGHKTFPDYYGSSRRGFFIDQSSYSYPDGKNPQSAPVASFCTLWFSVNGKESWDANPWVWVIEFKVLSTTGKP